MIKVTVSLVYNIPGCLYLGRSLISNTNIPSLLLPVLEGEFDLA
jgi:hypothetical protein